LRGGVIPIPAINLKESLGAGRDKRIWNISSRLPSGGWSGGRIPEKGAFLMGGTVLIRKGESNAESTRMEKGVKCNLLEHPIRGKKKLRGLCSG